MNDEEYLEEISYYVSYNIEAIRNFLYDKNTLDRVLALSYEMSECIKGGGSIVVFGNGGSAADAQHFVAELVGKFNMERKPISAHCLNDNASIITAISNDYTYSEVFARQVEAYAKQNDVVFIGISTSGKSLNVINALVKANEGRSITAMLSGENCPDYSFVEFMIKVKSKDTSIIQNAHIIILHIIAMIVEKEIFGTG